RMKGQETVFSIRRILVALDASLPSRHVLEAAIDLAQKLEAELLGLFVEDMNLLRLAELPFARVSALATEKRPLDSPSMARALKVQAERVQRMLESMAQQAQVRWSFRIVRGDVASAVLAASTEVDLLALGRISRPLTKQVRLGSTARTVATRASRPVLILSQGRCVGQPVLLIYDGSPGTKAVLSLAASLVSILGSRLVVLLPADGPDLARHYQAEVEEWLEGKGVSVRYHSLPHLDLPGLISAVRGEGGGLLVLSSHSPLLQGEGVQKLLEELDCPVLLIR
ncbi:MAG: universal stress protein, partial [Nitrospinota bacterium]